MAKNKKPKFLEAETSDLLALLKETLSGDEVDEKATAKALKITEELISRQPGDEGPISVDEALKAAADTMTEALNKVKGAYENEISMMEDEDDSDEEEDSDDGEDGEDYSDWSTKDLKKECRTRGIKVTKGMAKADMVKALEADDKE